MTYEPFDWKAEEAGYREHLAREAEEYIFARQQIQRNEWAQRHGNDSGFDPYAEDDSED